MPVTRFRGLISLCHRPASAGVRALNDKAVGQGELFPAWHYHAVFTDSPLEMIQSERTPPGPSSPPSRRTSCALPAPWPAPAREGPHCHSCLVSASTCIPLTPRWAPLSTLDAMAICSPAVVVRVGGLTAEIFGDGDGSG